MTRKQGGSNTLQRAFSGKGFEDVTTEAGSLPPGDYFLEVYAKRVAVERKSLADLVACLSHERERIERELKAVADAL